MALLAAVLGLVFAGQASANAWRPVAQQCYAPPVTGTPACQTIRAGDGIWQLALSPDGRNVYGLAWSSRALIIFDRDPNSGALSQRGAGGCYSEDGSGGLCVRARGLQNPVGIQVSPDGRNVYVAFAKSTPFADATSGGGGIAVFRRNAAGDLSQADDPSGCVSWSTSTSGTPGVCTSGRGLYSVESLIVSPDGQHVYTGGPSIAAFYRDPASGALTQLSGAHGCVNDTSGEGCAAARGLGGSQRQMAFSPDGTSLYVPSYHTNALTAFDRDPSTGRLHQKDAGGCMATTDLGGQCSVEPKMVTPRAAFASPDGRHVYVSANGTLLTFGRAPDGALALQSCVSDTGGNGCATGRNLAALTFGSVSPDGQTVVVQNEQTGRGFSVFERDATGNLRQEDGLDGCVTSDGSGVIYGNVVPGACHVNGSQRGHGTVNFASDGNLITASHWLGGAVTSFKRDFYPVCADQTITATQHVAAALPLACSDRNGDPLSFEITRQPASGALSTIDQAGANVFYVSLAGFLGGDALRYRASAAGLVSNEATTAINVVPPQAGPPPPIRPQTVASPVTYNWSVRRSQLTLRQLVVSRLPVGATVTLSCSGKRCKFKTRTIKRSRKATMNVLNAKTMKGRKTFRAGQTLDIRIAAPGMNTKLLRFKLRSGKVPKHRTYCVPLGAKKAQRTCS